MKGKINEGLHFEDLFSLSHNVTISNASYCVTCIQWNSLIKMIFKDNTDSKLAGIWVIQDLVRA